MDKIVKFMKFFFKQPYIWRHLNIFLMIFSLILFVYFIFIKKCSHSSDELVGDSRYDSINRDTIKNHFDIGSSNEHYFMYEEKSIKKGDYEIDKIMQDIYFLKKYETFNDKIIKHNQFLKMCSEILMNKYHFNEMISVVFDSNKNESKIVFNRTFKRISKKFHRLAKVICTIEVNCIFYNNSPCKITYNFKWKKFKNETTYNIVDDSEFIEMKQYRKFVFLIKSPIFYDDITYWNP